MRMSSSSMVMAWGRYAASLQDYVEADVEHLEGLWLVEAADGVWCIVRVTDDGALVLDEATTLQGIEDMRARWVRGNDGRKS